MLSISYILLSRISRLHYDFACSEFIIEEILIGENS